MGLGLWDLGGGTWSVELAGGTWVVGLTGGTWTVGLEWDLLVGLGLWDL